MPGPPRPRSPWSRAPWSTRPGAPWRAATRADRSGAFTLPVRRPWQREVVRAAAPGYLVAHASPPAAGPRAAEEIVLLLEPAVALTGSVVDGAGRPIGAAEVRVIETGENAWWRGGAATYAQTDRSGRFRIEGLGARASPWAGYGGHAQMIAGDAQVSNLAPGQWTVTVTAADGRTWTGTTSVAPGAPTRLVLE